MVASAAAFTGVAQNTTTPYCIAGLSGIYWHQPANALPPDVTPYPIPGTLGGYTNAGTVLTVAGNVTQFNANQLFTNGTGITVGVGTATAAGLGTTVTKPSTQIQLVALLVPLPRSANTASPALP